MFILTLSPHLARVRWGWDGGRRGRWSGSRTYWTSRKDPSQKAGCLEWRVTLLPAQGSQFSSWDLLFGRFLPNSLHLAATPHSISAQRTVPVTAHACARAHPCPCTQCLHMHTHMHAYHMHQRTWPHLHMHTYGHRRAHTPHSRFQPYPDRWLQVRSPWVSGACTWAPSRTDLSVTLCVLEASCCSALEASLSLNTALPFPLTGSTYSFGPGCGACSQEVSKEQPGHRSPGLGDVAAPPRKTSALGPSPMEPDLL